MNENRRIDNPWIRIVQCVGALKMKTCVESLQKHTMGLIFNIQNSQLLNWPLPTDEIFQVHEKNRTVAKIPAVDFRLRQNRRQVASFLYAQPLCIENWIRNKSFKNCFNVGSVTKKLRIWNFDGLRTSIFYQFEEWKFPKPPYEVSTVGRLVDSNHNRPRTPVQLECN